MAKPESVGYELRDVVYETTNLVRFSTSETGIFIEIFGKPVDPSNPELEKRLNHYDTIRRRFIEYDMEICIPEVVDQDLEDGWIAIAIPDGMYTLPEVAKSYPNGLVGKDWAWMLKRILMILQLSSTPPPKMAAENILIHPEGHFVALLGWNLPSRDEYPLENLAIIMQEYLAATADNKTQIEFVEHLGKLYRKNRYKNLPMKDDPEDSEPLFNYGDAVEAYKIKVESLYGERKFRPFKIDENLSKALS